MLDFKGKTVLVTGSTRGIGRAIAEEFAKHGANVIVSGTVEERAQALAQELADKYGVQTLGVGMDVSDPQSVEEAFKKINAAFGGVDILVNNAGITRDTLFLRMKLEDWEKVLQVNLTGTFLVTKQVVRYMTKKRWGRIINPRWWDLPETWDRLTTPPPRRDWWALPNRSPRSWRPGTCWSTPWHPALSKPR